MSGWAVFEIAMLQYVPLPKTAPTGFYPSKDQRTSGGSHGYVGFQNGWLAPNRQEVTFFLSWAVQLGVLITSLIAMTQGDVPETLLLILGLETGVQGIEFLWYTGVGFLYLFGPACNMGVSIDVGYRYIDWMITTPLMLVSLMFFGLWEANRCVRNEDLLGADTTRVIALIVIVTMDLWMLAVGSSYANRGDQTMLGRAWAWLAEFYNMWTPFGGKDDGIFVGWIPFLGAFAPLFVMMVTDKFKIGGQLTISISFVAWAVYGVIAVLHYWRTDAAGNPWLNAINANTAYNLMDIVSKNVMGVVVSTVVFNGDYNTTTLNCTVVDGRPYEWDTL